MIKPDVLPARPAAGQPEVWLMDPDGISRDWIERHLSLLAPEERLRAEAFGSPRLRHDYLCTRVMQRLVLSGRADVDPAAWRFTPAAGGKPSIAMPEDHRWLRFNISHTRGLIALALCRDAEIGVDVEALHTAVEVTAVARRFFAAEEVTALLDLDGPARHVRFFEHWTLKEACLKAFGTGFATALDAARFGFRQDGTVTAVLSPDLTRGSSHWSFETLKPTANHVLGMALLSPSVPAAGPCLRPRWFAA